MGQTKAMEDDRTQDVRRVRGALITLVIGVILLLWVWTMAMLGSLNAPATNPAVLGDGELTTVMPITDDADDAKIKRLHAAPLMLVTGLALVLVFLVSSYVLVRGSRRLASGIGEGRSKPTTVTDVWSTHVLPEDRPRHRD